MHVQNKLSSPALHRLLSQLFVEIRGEGGGGERGERGRFLHLSQPNVGSAVSTQNHLQSTEDYITHKSFLSQLL